MNHTTLLSSLSMVSQPTATPWLVSSVAPLGRQGALAEPRRCVDEDESSTATLPE